MAILLEGKVLQNVEYDLYFKTYKVYNMTNLVVLRLDGYASVGHFNDTFLPIIQRTENITDTNATESFNSNYIDNPTLAIATIEAWLIDHVDFYSGGSVV